MMEFDLTVLAVTITPGAKTSTMEVAYKNEKFGKTDSKKLNSYYGTLDLGADGWAMLAGAKQGDRFTVSQEKEPAKDGKEYWKWKSVRPAGTPGNVVGSASTATQTAVSSTPGHKSSYGVNDDKKQNMIIRQSSISSAVNLLKDVKGITANSVIATAAMFEDFVYNGLEKAVAPVKATKQEETSPFDDLEDFPE